MNARAFAALSLSALLAHAAYASDVRQASAGLRENYVSGLKLISDTRAAINQAGEVLTLVESGADAQGSRINDMEAKMAAIETTNQMLATQGSRGFEQGRRLLGEKSRIEVRFQALGTALDSSEALLSGATKTVGELLTAADTSGRIAERRLADHSAEQLKNAAESLRKSALRLAQMQLRVKLEVTLVEGLQSKAAATGNEVKGVAEELTALRTQVARQRESINALSTSLLKSRQQLNSHSLTLAANIESFRVVQVSVLRHWLLDGPPDGDIPALTLTDVIEEEFRKRPSQPTPSLTMFGPGGAAGLPANTENVVEDNFMIRGLNPADVGNALDLSEATQEIIQLHRRANWYIAMLDRLNSFASESLSEAEAWCTQAEAWRDELSYFGTTLASQRGQLSSMQMEQDIIATTVALIARQAETAQAQVGAVAAECAEKAATLQGITAALLGQSRSGLR